MELEITDTIGVELGDSSYVLGAIEEVCHGLQGEILVLDRSAACIRTYDSTGVFLGAIGRRGSAPGELLNPIGLATLEDGRIVVIDPWRGGLFVWSADGAYQEQVAEMVSNTPALLEGTSDSGFIAGKVTPDVINEQIVVTTALLRYDLSGEPTRTYNQVSFELDPMNMGRTLEHTLFWGSFTADRDGNVYFAEMDPESYRITGMHEDGAEFLSVEHPVEPVEKTPEEMADERAYVLARLEGWNAQWGINDYDPQPMRNQVRDLPGVDRFGRLWALRGTREDPTFDVFDSQTGDKLFTAVIPGVGYQGLFWSFHVDQGGMAAWSADPEGYPQVYIIELPSRGISAQTEEQSTGFASR